MCSFYPLSSPFWSLSRDSWCIFPLRCRVKVHFKSQSIRRQSDQAFCISSKAFVLVLSNPYFVLCFASWDVFSRFSVTAVSRDSQQDELSAAALRSLRAVLHFCCGNPHSSSGITVSAALRQTDGWQIFCTANIGFIKSLGTKLLLLVLSSSVYLVQPRRKATQMYALSESNMPADVPSDCVSLHSSLILKVILGRFCSDYSSGRANSQPWARIHLWGTSAGNNTKVDAPGTQHLIKIVFSQCVFYDYMWLYMPIRQIEQKINDDTAHFRFSCLTLWTSKSVQVRKMASNHSPDEV